MFVVFENLMALYIAIEEECPPEIAFKRLDRFCGQIVKNLRFPWTDKDLHDIEIYRSEGITWKEIGNYFGVAESTIHLVYNNYKNC